MARKMIENVKQINEEMKEEFLEFLDEYDYSVKIKM